METNAENSKFRFYNPMVREVSNTGKRQSATGHHKSMSKRIKKNSAENDMIGDEPCYENNGKHEALCEPENGKVISTPQVVQKVPQLMDMTQSSKDNINQFDIPRLLEEYNECIARIRKNVLEAQKLVKFLAQEANCSHNDVNNESTPVSKQWRSLPSSEPIWSSDDNETTVKVESNAWKHFDLRDFNVDIDRCRDAAVIWKLWKEGTQVKPSVEFMNETFGTFAFVSDKREKSLFSCWAKVVQEMEHHLESGRDLDEVIAVTNLHLESLGGDVRSLARSIMENMEHGKTTLFEWSSSRGTMQI